MPLESLADDSLAASLALLDAGSVARTGRTCSRLAAVARADLLWLPLAERRWRFGAVATSAAALPPGLRDAEAAAALAGAAAPPQDGGLRSDAGSCPFYSRRRRQDVEVSLLVLQMQAAEAVSATRGGAAAGGVERELPLGTVVEIVGLQSAPQYNGCVGVVSGLPEGAEERFGVSLASSFRTLSVKRQSLKVQSPAISSQEARERVLAFGASAIDQLARTAAAAPSAGATGNPGAAAVAQRLLAAATERWAVGQWEQLVADVERVDLLEEGGLVVSQWAEPLEADVKAARAMLAQLADAVATQVVEGAPLRDRVAAVGRVLFDEYGFSGNVENYYDPRNSFLHSVLARRRGIPISLSIVWAAVARRVAIPCFLCTNMPTHILIRVSMEGAGLVDDLYVDAFGRKVMDFEGLRSFAQSLGLDHFYEDYVAPRPATAVYARLLRNLRNIYQEAATQAAVQGDVVVALESYLGTCSQMIAIADPSPSSAREVEQLRHVREQVRRRIDQAPT